MKTKSLLFYNFMKLGMISRDCNFAVYMSGMLFLFFIYFFIYLFFFYLFFFLFFLFFVFVLCVFSPFSSSIICVFFFYFMTAFQVYCWEDYTALYRNSADCD